MTTTTHSHKHWTDKGGHVTMAASANTVEASTMAEAERSSTLLSHVCLEADCHPGES